MPWTMGHTIWFIGIGERLKTANGKKAEVCDLDRDCEDIQVRSKYIINK